MRKHVKQRMVAFAADGLTDELNRVRAKLASAKARRPRYLLEQYRSVILLLRDMDASYAEIQMVLARHRIRVSVTTVRNTLLRWQQQKGRPESPALAMKPEIFTLKADDTWS